jgi:hypothetical protein
MAKSATHFSARITAISSARLDREKLRLVDIAGR